jgi:hypothetical protein
VCVCEFLCICVCVCVCVRVCANLKKCGKKRNDNVNDETAGNRLDFRDNCQIVRMSEVGHETPYKYLCLVRRHVASVNEIVKLDVGENTGVWSDVMLYVTIKMVKIVVGV